MNSFGSGIQKSLITLLSDFGSGIMLKVLRPFSKGDFIEVDGQLGAIEKSGLRHTTIKKIDGTSMVINNAVFYTKSLHNLSSKNIISLDLKISVSYQSDMTRIKEEILTFIGQDKRLLNSPTPKIQASKIKNDFIELTVTPWCLLDDFLELDASLEECLKQYLSSRHITLEQDQLVYANAKMLA